MRVFFDTSALAKRYVDEVGSEQVRDALRRGGCPGSQCLALPELISTLCRLVREGRLSEETTEPQIRREGRPLRCRSL